MQTEAQKRWYEENKEHHREMGRKWAMENPESASLIKLRHRLKKNYGMTLEEYNHMVESCNNQCQICGHTPDGSKLDTRLCVDHNHETGEVRGLICRRCNLMLGYAIDNPEILTNAIKYLLK